MPLVVRIALGVGVGVLLLGGVMAWSARGSAILMELGAGVAGVLCL